MEGKRRRRGGGRVQYVVILGDDGASWCDCGYMHGFRSWILRSILVPALLFCVCRIWCRARVDNGIGMLGLVLLVSSTHFALCSLLLFPFSAQCLSSVVHVMRQSTEFLVFLHEFVDYGSSGRFLTLRTGSLYLTVTCTVFGFRLWSTRLRISLGDHFWIYSRIQRYLVRQWIHVGVVYEACFAGTVHLALCSFVLSRP